MIQTNSVPNEQELQLINKYTRRPLNKDEVYIFSVVLCDNDIDRDNESFSTNALYQMKSMFLGKTGIFDHNPSAENQTARIYDCYVEQLKDKKTAYNSDYYRLVAKAYIPKCSRNNDLIISIDSGITKEVSVSCAVNNTFCSICGSDTHQNKCSHKAGKKYGNNICHTILDSITDVYEWSFVAVPAQKQAGIIKSYNKYKGDAYRMDNILELIKKGKCITLSEDDCKQINDKINKLETLANDGQVYKQDLQKSVIRLYSLDKPTIPSNIINSFVSKMDIDELKAFKNALENQNTNNTQIFYNSSKTMNSIKNNDFNI